MEKKMAEKPSVAALEEYCKKKKIAAPTYEWIDSEGAQDGFICRAEVMDIEADGCGRSKRDAKHLAAANIIKLLRIDNPDIDEIPQVESVELPTTDMVTALRDYCVQQKHPLPTFEIIHEGGTPNAPQFTTLCTVASIKRIGVSEKKKDARQKAAATVFDVIKNFTTVSEYKMEIQSLDAAVADVEAERYHKFKTYRELTNTTIGETSGVKLSDRHNYFTNFYDHLKQKAKKILSEEYDSKQEQVKDLFDALKLKPCYKEVPSVNTVEPLVSVELDCDYDFYLIALKSEIHAEILDYFRIMLT